MPKVFILLKEENGEENLTYSPKKHSKLVHFNIPKVGSKYQINFEILSA